MARQCQNDDVLPMNNITFHNIIMYDEGISL